MKKPRSWVYWLAGFGFWLPSLAVHAIRGNQFGAGPVDIMSVTVIPVAAAVLTLWALSRRRRMDLTRRSIALWMLVGVWMLGPLCMTIGASFSGGGFAQPGAWQLILLSVPLFVPLTFMMSVYDGTLAALVIVTIWLIGAALRRSERRSAPSLSSGL